MDARAARRAAEKAARDLISSRGALVGKLGVVQADAAQLSDDLAAAADRGRQLFVEAEAEPCRLVASADHHAQEGEQR